VAPTVEQYEEAINFISDNKVHRKVVKEMTRSQAVATIADRAA